MFLTFLMAGLLLAAIALMYNRLIRDRNRVDSAWSDIDVQLQRRHDLIPRLADSVRAYADYERATLEAVTELRDQARRMSAADVEKRGEIEEEIGTGMTRLIALAEDYPDLKASENFLSLQEDLVETENYLQFARRFYNGAVRQYNTSVELFPLLIVARIFKFDLRQFFQKSSDDVANVPLVDLGSVE